MAIADFRFTFQALIDETFRLARDPNGERFGQDADQAIVKDYINQAQAEFCLETGLIRVREEMALDATLTTGVYNFLTTLAAIVGYRNFVKWIQVEYLSDNSYLNNISANSVLEYFTTERFDRLGYYPEDADEQPLRFMTDMLAYGKMRLHPIPNVSGVAATSNVLKIIYEALPNLMTTAATHYPDTLIPVIYQRAIPKRAAAYLLEDGDEDDLNLAIILIGSFLEDVKRAKIADSNNRTKYLSARPC